MVISFSGYFLSPASIQYNLSWLFALQGKADTLGNEGASSLGLTKSTNHFRGIASGKYDLKSDLNLSIT